MIVQSLLSAVQAEADQRTPEILSRVFDRFQWNFIGLPVGEFIDLDDPRLQKIRETRVPIQFGTVLTNTAKPERQRPITMPFMYHSGLWQNAKGLGFLADRDIMSVDVPHPDVNTTHANIKIETTVSGRVIFCRVPGKWPDGNGLHWVKVEPWIDQFRVWSIFGMCSYAKGNALVGHPYRWPLRLDKSASVIYHGYRRDEIIR